MNFFTKNKFLYKLITCLCMVLIFISFLKPSKSYAAEEDDESGVGGILLGPICDLLQGVGDGVMNLLQKSIMGTKATISVDNSDPKWWETLLAVVIALVVIALVVVAAIYAPGLLLAALKAVGLGIVKAAVGFGAAGLILGVGTVAGRIGIGISSDWR